MLTRRRTMGRSWRFVAPLALGLLAACAGPDGAARLNADAPVAGTASPDHAAPAVRPSPRPARTGAAQAAVLRVPGQASRGLMGMSGGEVGAMLGRPALLRREQPAEVWQYRASECVLFVFFFDAEDGQGARVEHVEARQRGTAQPMPEADCLRRMAGPSLVSGWR